MAENEIDGMEIQTILQNVQQSIIQVGIYLANMQIPQETIVWYSFHFTHLAEWTDGCDAQAVRGKDTSVRP